MVAEAHYTIDKNMKLFIEVDNSEPLQPPLFAKAWKALLQNIDNLSKIIKKALRRGPFFVTNHVPKRF
ncbi:MAG: hypothetical protein HXM22_02000 [Haemophilus parainfluenzae]|nr:hypothetical protein [Haemophilus parainfluenzae]